MLAIILSVLVVPPEFYLNIVARGGSHFNPFGISVSMSKCLVYVVCFVCESFGVERFTLSQQNFIED